MSLAVVVVRVDGFNTDFSVGETTTGSGDTTTFVFVRDTMVVFVSTAIDFEFSTQPTTASPM
jgi:hypothetical protein